MAEKDNYENNWDGFLSQKAYQVDTNKYGKSSVKENFEFKGQKYHVVYNKDDKSNGFQGLAVAPIVNGKVNYNDVQIATAGTNPDDINDLVTDGTEITESRAIGGPIVSAVGDIRYVLGDSQFNSADRFYDKVQDKLDLQGMKDGKSYFIKHGTAHSLGGALMFYLAAKHHFPITTFSSADPRDRLNFEELAFINKHPEMFKDYYHLTDWVGDWQVMARLGNPKAVKEVFSKQAGITRFLGLNGHYLDSYAFSKSGDLFNDPIEELDDELESLDAEYERLKANNALTDAETVMLDASAAILLAKAIKSEANDGADEVISELNTLIKNANNYWKQTKSMCDNMSPDLSYDDVLNCLDRGGANYHTMVGTFKDKYDERIRKAKKIKNKFNDWYDQTTAGISKMVGDDQELAGMFKK